MRWDQLYADGRTLPVVATEESHLTLRIAGRDVRCLDIGAITAERARPLPFSLRVVLENLLLAPSEQTTAVAREICAWGTESPPIVAPLTVSRVIFPDSSGLPALMDLAALRDALARRGQDPGVVEPVIPLDLVVDHSLIVDRFGTNDAIDFNVRREYQRNGERYAFFKWAQQAFERLRVVPPGMGIIHQVHIEYLAKVVGLREQDSPPMAFSEFVLGCDSHTPMVNALGVLGWGVGGIDAEATLVGHPYAVRIPRVVGVRLRGRLRAGVTTTDLVLTVTERLRRVGVVGDFVEFTGDGLDTLGVPERATIANMAPEYGATCGFFPIDGRTIDYLRATGRPDDHVALVEAYAQAAGMFRHSDAPEPEFSAIVEIDLDAVEASVAGPKRPQDRAPLSDVAAGFRRLLETPAAEGGFGAERPDARATVDIAGAGHCVGHGVLAIAAITSCTNTSNPAVMIGAGLLARNAVRRGLRVPAWVKTSLAPGSRVVARYLEETGLLADLEALGFYLVGFGCTTCSGKSGPLVGELEEAIAENRLVAAAALSGNRNFEGRIHKSVQAAYLCSPPLVVAYALAGRIDIDFRTEPLGRTAEGEPVLLRDIWPDPDEIDAIAGEALSPAQFCENYARIFEGTELWQTLEAPSGPLFAWNARSTYIKQPPFFSDDFIASRTPWPDTLRGARALCVFGDSLTTDHVTPSGEISEDTLAGRYLAEQGVAARDFNAYTQRRGNHEVLARATFANPRIRNRLMDGETGGFTRKFPEGLRMNIHDAAEAYRREGVPLIVLAGSAYGMGSSRDWAAKGPALLGVRAIVAKDFERIHRSNLIGLGIAPLVFAEAEGVDELGLTGAEVFEIAGLGRAIADGGEVTVTARADDGKAVTFTATLDVSGPDERKLLADGGLFPRMLHWFADGHAPVGAMARM